MHEDKHETYFIGCNYYTYLTVLDFRCCLCLLTGVILFWNSVALSKSVTFYYTSGTALGILASSLVLIFILSRFVKKVGPVKSFVLFQINYAFGTLFGCRRIIYIL